jgi:CHAD domain-containing protein
MKRSKLVSAGDLRSYAHETSVRFIDVLYENYAKLGADENIEHLHDMRVASRRLRETYSVFAPFYEASRLKKTGLQVKRLTRTLGLSREMDVNFELLQEFSPPAKPLIQVAHEHLLEIAAQDQQKVRRRVMKSLKKMRIKGLRGDFLKGAKVVLNRQAVAEEAGMGDPGMESNKFWEWATDLACGKLKALEEFRELQAVPENDGRLHQLRIRIKKLRYTLEICSPLLQNRFQESIESAKRLQDLLGKIHDYGVLLEHLSRHRDHLEQAARPRLAAGCQSLIQSLSGRKQTFYPQFQPAFQAFLSELTPLLPKDSLLMPEEKSSLPQLASVPDSYADF